MDKQYGYRQSFKKRKTPISKVTFTIETATYIKKINIYIYTCAYVDMSKRNVVNKITESAQ